MADSLFFVTAFLASGGVAVYIFLGTKLRESNRIVTSAYGWPDTVFCGLLCLYFLMSIARPPASPLHLTLPQIRTSAVFYLVLDFLILSFLMVRNISPTQVFGLKALRGLPLLFLPLLWMGALYPIVVFAQALVEKIFGAGIPPMPLVQFLQDHPHWLAQSTVAILAVVVAPLTEELIFRGYLYGVIRKQGGRLCAILISSMLFAAIHLHVPSFPGLFCLAVGLSIVYEVTGSLLATALMHSLFNMLGVVIAIWSPHLHL